MKLSVKILVLLAIGCIAVTEGCQHGTARRKRSTHGPTAPQVDETLANFFEECLSGPASGIFDSLRSVVDTVIRDSVWYRDVKAEVCSDEQDVAECWIYTLPFLLDIDSSLYEPTAQCICDWSKKCWDPPSGIDKRQAPESRTQTYTYKPRPTRPPPLSRELRQFSSCTDKNMRKFVRQYPSLKKFDGGSNSIFFRDHYTYCRSIPKFPYEQRNLFVLLYIKRVCPKTGSKSTWRKDVINVYQEATRKDGPLSEAVDTCDPNSKPDPCNPNPCKNGRCKVYGDDYRCHCDKGYTGKHCENGPCQPNPCLNFGKCTVKGSSYYCTCRNGYSGKNCEKGSDVCKPNPCKNGGKCTEVRNRYRCACEIGFSGEHCENGPFYGGEICTDDAHYCTQFADYVCSTPSLTKNCRKTCKKCSPFNLPFF